MYIPAQLLPMEYANDVKFKYRPNAWNTAVDFAAFLPPDDAAKAKAIGALIKGELIAWDPAQQKAMWRVPHEFFWNGGVLSTAGNLVFEGGGTGQFQAYRADDGKPLWDFKAPSGILAAPVTYSVGGRQFIAVLSGWGGLVVNSAPGPQQVASPGRVLAFALDGRAALPAEAIQPLPPANPSSDAFTDAQVQLGKTIYGGTCGMCHGWGVVGGDLIPDLRRVGAVTDRALWHSIIIDGILQNAGMVSFKPYLSPDDAEAVRAYVSQQAQLLQAVEKGAAREGAPAVTRSTVVKSMVQ
jgi:alcohol dehydrogenase (cytochrome c)/quinohemoprotein ethanol dehydrogenase